MNQNRSWLIIIIVMIIFGFSLRALIRNNGQQPETQSDNESPPAPQPTPTPLPADESVASPISKASERVTKKPFGIYITKANSPVTPERFAGYHTGTDFEAFTEETDAEVEIYAICQGKILQKRSAAGYGGFLVQSCTLDNQAVTVIYGHIDLGSVTKNAEDSFTKGERIGILGQPGPETDNERKHLHLGIHKSSEANIQGYVQNQSLLDNWLDYQKL